MRKLEDHYLLILFKWIVYLTSASILVFCGGIILGEWIIPFYQNLSPEAKKEIFIWVLVAGFLITIWALVSIAKKVLKEKE